ncbi:hypothetical protein ACC687_37565, partial [Rhizobium ruizarguesonis]
VPVLIGEPKQAGVSIWRRLQLFFGMLLLILVGAICFWLWYVTTSTTPFQSPGMDINNLMPAPFQVGCECKLPRTQWTLYQPCRFFTSHQR